MRSQKPKVNKLRKADLRMLGFLPLIFFITQALHYWQINELGHVLWMCNIGNLMLALGMIFEKPALVRVAVIWMIPGVIVWAIYVVPTWGMFFTGQFNWSQDFGVLASSLAHIGGLALGLVALRRVRMNERAWLYAFGWYFVMQLISRLFTSAVLNVNLSHRVQDGFEQSFPSYWRFWLLLSLIVGVASWLIGYAFRMFWGLPSERSE